MPESEEPRNWPDVIENTLAGIGRALIPGCVKALDRLVGAGIDIPVAWLAQKKARIEAQTGSFMLVEEAVGKAVASLAGADEATIRRGLEALVRTSYRKERNREAVASAMLDDIAAMPITKAQMGDVPGELDDDWLNVFERYAEDASTERMQKLWGRVLAGEIRKPGRFSARTLRFLSEFSKSDGLNFAAFCALAFSDLSPKILVRPTEDSDIKTLIYLESSGLIQGASGMGLKSVRTFDAHGHIFLMEADLVIVFEGSPGSKVAFPIIALTPLGQELMALLPGRDAKDAARKVAHALRQPEIKTALLGQRTEDPARLGGVEVLWQKEAPTIEMKAAASANDPVASDRLTKG